MGDGTRHFNSETKVIGCLLHPVVCCVLARDVIKCGIDFKRGKMAGVKFEPMGVGEVQGIKRPLPVVKTPGTSADLDFSVGIHYECEPSLSDAKASYHSFVFNLADRLRDRS